MKVRWNEILALSIASVVPVVTDRFETGSWPSEPWDWFTEVVCGITILTLGLYAMSRLLRSREDLSRAVTELDRLARTDALTGLRNSRSFFEAVATHQNANATWVVVADLDKLKRVNDTRGHPAGDALLVRAASVLRDAAASCGAGVFRTGGDEFSMVLLGSDVLVRTVGRDILVRMDGDPDGSTFSIGAAMLAAGESVADAIGRADEALYGAKRAGGNRLCMSPPKHIGVTTAAKRSSDEMEERRSVPASARGSR